MQQAKPWLSDPIVKPAGPVYGAPPKVDVPTAFETEDQRLQREAAARAVRGEGRDVVEFETDRRKAPLDIAKSEQDLRSAPGKRAGELRTEFNKLPEVQKFSALAAITERSINAPETPQGDLAIIYGHGTAMDPNSVVRGEEMEMAKATASLPEEWREWASRVERGERLPPSVRKGLVDSIRNATLTQNRAYSHQYERYMGLARGEGFDHHVVTGKHLGEPFVASEQAFLDRQGGGDGQPERMSIPAYEKALNDILSDESKSPEQRKQEALALSRQALKTPNEEDLDKAIIARGGKVVAGAGPDDLIKQGMMFGLGDEAAGIGNAAANIITSPFTDAKFDPIGAYQEGKGAEQARLAKAREAMGWGGTAAEIGGAVMSGVPRAVAALPTLAGRAWQGAKVGGAMSALAGFGYGEGLGGSLLNAAKMGAGGLAAGAALPVGVAVAGNALNGFRTMFSQPGTVAARNIRNALDADGLSVADVGRNMDAAQANGVPAMMADQGENLRGLLGSVTRRPGPSRRLAGDALRTRQLEQGERIEAAIARDLGPISDPHKISRELAEEASTRATPLYDEFRAAPGASSVKMDDLMSRPSFRDGLKKAAKSAAERNDDLTALGFDLDEAGEVVLTKVPSWQALDYIKRGMDDVVYDTKNALTGAPKKTHETTDIQNTRRMLVARMDAINPHYAPARAAFAGPTAAAEAMEKGLKALNKNANDINATVDGMTPFQLEHYQLGLRSAMADMVASRSDTGDKVQALIGTRKKRASFARVFGGQAELDRFMGTLDAEGAAQATYNRALTGSPTALNEVTDELTSDLGLLESAVGAAVRGGQNGGVWGSVMSLIARAREADNLGVGRAGEEARESIAALLTQTDPMELQAVLQEVQRGMAGLARSQARQSAVGTRGAGYAGAGMGAGIGSSQQPAFEPR